MKKVVLLLAIAATATFTACKKKEVTPTPTPQQENAIADFTFTGNLSNPPAVIKFTNTSKNATSYNWDFGDGSPTSSEISPSHTYIAPGNYDVKLTATGNGPISSKTQKITVLQPLMSKVSVSKIVLRDIPFTDASGNAYDPLSNPDIFFQFGDEANSIAYVTGSRFDDVTKSMFPLTWTFSSPVTFSLFEKRAVRFYDYDTPDPSDFMGGILFDFSKLTDYPTSVDANVSGVNMTIYLSWSE